MWIHRNPIKSVIITAVAGLVLFFGSCAFFAYSTLDQGISYTYLEVSYEDAVKERDTLLAIALEISPESSKDEVMSLMKKKFPTATTFEKDGYTVYGPLVFKFSEEGKLSDVASTINYQDN
ncbi:MAG: hypothetical protein AAFY98_07470 [Verrucomicrobiota bacterium]